MKKSQLTKVTMITIISLLQICMCNYTFFQSIKIFYFKEKSIFQFNRYMTKVFLS